MKSIKLSFLPLLFLFILFQFSTSLAAKKTICSVTINSDDEILSFKKNLPSSEFEFIELTTFKDSQSKSWLRSACEAGVECDVLVVSGHFAGTFFGSSGKTLPLRDLEKSACLEECAGIFKKTKEVYLFGCNTLAGKEKDSRTPEQYLQVLLSDGFSLGQAQQVVAFRYSPIGGSFANRMRSVFTNTPKIYGFNSKSPLGKHVGPLLNKYFQKRASQFSSMIDTQSKAQINELLGFFKSTSMVHAAGMSLSLDPQQKLEMSPVCFLASSNEKNSRAEKLRWIQNMFAKGNGLEMLMYVSEFLHQEKNRRRWNSEEKAIFMAIKENQTLKQDLMNIVNSPQPWLDRSKIDVLTFIKEMDWMDTDTVNQKIYAILKLDSKSFNVEDMRRVCSYGIQYSIDIYDFNASQWNNNYFKYAIMCITPDNDYRIWSKLNESVYGN